MTKFQIVLTYIKKYIFWVISGLCLVISFIVGTSVSGSKQADFKAKVSEIENHFSEMQRLAGEDIPNEMVVDQKKKDVVNLKETIIDAWYQLYNPQVQYFENLWPDFRNAQGDVDAQAADYLDELQKTWHSQTVFDPTDNMSLEVQDAYRQYVTQIQEFDFMTRYKIYVPQTKDGIEGGLVAGMVNNPLQETTSTTGVELPSEGMCTWDDANRLQMRRRFRILSRAVGGGKKINSTRKVLLVQEDIWMYDILLGAISKMNEKSEGSHDAVVKRIFRIDVADDASTLNSTGDDPSQRGSGRASARESRGFDEKDKTIVFNAEERVVSVAEPQRTGNEELGEGDVPVEPMEEEEASSGMADTEFEEIFDYRYCDSYGNFMSSADLAAYLKTKPEYIMMPVHVKILINQKKIPQFLLNCLNSEIPIYIHQISIQARDLDSIRHHLEIVPEEDSVSAENGEGMGSSPRQTRRSSREDLTNDLEDRDSQEMLNDSMLDRTNENGEIDRRKPEDVEFEMWGMICLFNKPDESKFESVLTEESASEGEEGEESSDSEENADDETADDESADTETADDETADAETTDEEPVDEEAELMNPDEAGAEKETEEVPAGNTGDSAEEEEAPPEDAEN